MRWRPICLAVCGLISILALTGCGSGYANTVWYCQTPTGMEQIAFEKKTWSAETEEGAISGEWVEEEGLLSLTSEDGTYTACERTIEDGTNCLEVYDNLGGLELYFPTVEGAETYYANNLGADIEAVRAILCDGVWSNYDYGIDSWKDASVVEFTGGQVEFRITSDISSLEHFAFLNGGYSGGYTIINLNTPEMLGMNYSSSSYEHQGHLMLDGGKILEFIIFEPDKKYEHTNHWGLYIYPADAETADLGPLAYRRDA